MRENKTELIKFRCTKRERRKIERMAEKFGSISKFLLYYVISEKKTIIEPKTFLEGMNNLTIAVNRVGNNINQISRLINTYKDTNDYSLMQRWFELFSEYNSVIYKVYDVILKLYNDKTI